MIRKIGKYDVQERIGRGGMGIVFRAHDPVLDRPVAIKIISDDLDVTDEVRTRFFREAQACAKLSHRNIVTVHDMGEVDGRLYIVMEFLEGEDLRHLIAERRRLPLEDKVALMIQVCDGLDYAHQKGVIHRDIKPGNVIVLRDGTAKIVDFGIAHVATLGGGLTRTGLVMGSLRYISPEQARGRADHRSDMFSVGSVFYELIALRPALTGTDPMHLLEQLRSEEPIPLTELDAAVPADLSAVIAKAMRKDPLERFADLGEMRQELENVQLRLAGVATEVRARIAEQADRAHRLQEALAERIGLASPPAAPPVIPNRARLDTLLTLETDIVERSRKLEQLLGKADAVVPVLLRGLTHLDAGRWAEAMADFESVLTEVPEHARASAALGEARRRDDEERRRRHVGQRLQEARAAFERSAYRACLEMLADVMSEAQRFGLGDDAGGLREVAETAIRAEEAVQAERRRQHDVAESALPPMEDARALAHEVDAARRASALWLTAEDTADRGRAALAHEAFVSAAEAFAEATTLYRRAEEAAREAVRQEGLTRQRNETEQASTAMAEARERAEAVEARRRATSEWQSAEGREAAAYEAFSRASYTQALRLFREATGLYAESARTASSVHQEQHEQADQTLERAVQWRTRAEAASCVELAPTLWGTAEATLAEGNTALSAGNYPQATRILAEAESLYRHAIQDAESLLRQHREEAARGRRLALERRGAASSRDAPIRSAEIWDEAEARMVEANAAFAEGRYSLANGMFSDAGELFGRAEAAASDTIQREEQARRRVLSEQSRGAMHARRAAAQQLDAARRTTSTWRAAGERAEEGQHAHDERRYSEAALIFEHATALFREAEDAAREIAGREALARQRDDAERAEQTMVIARMAAAGIDAGLRARSQWNAAETKGAEARAALTRQEHARAASAFAEAVTLYGEAERHSQEAIRAEETRHQQRLAEQAQDVMTSRRAGAHELRANIAASSLWAAAETREREGRQAFDRDDFGQGLEAFTSAAGLYQQAEDTARRAMADAETTIVADRDHTLVVPPESGVPHPSPGLEEAEDTVGVATPRPSQDVEETMLADVPHVGEETNVDMTEVAARTEMVRAGVAPDVAYAEATVVGATPAPPSVSAEVSPDERARPGTEHAPRAGQRMLPWVLAAGIAAIALFGAAAGWLFRSGEVDRNKAEQAGLEQRTKRDQQTEAERLRAEQVKADQVKAEQVKADQVKAEQVKAEQVKAEQVKAERVKAEQVKAEQVKAEQVKAEQVKAEQVKAEQVKAEQARVAALAKSKLQAEERREAVSGVKLEAQRAGAVDNAAETVTSARRHERLAEEAFSRQDYEGATNALGLALVDYQSAKGATDALRGRMERARTDAGSAHREAIEARATELAREAFGEGAAKEKEAEELSRRDFSKARQAFADAARLFGSATSRARALAELRSQAEQARDRMRGEKQRAGRRSDTSDYKAAASKEDEGERAYARLLFADSREAFSVATDLYAKAAAIPPPPPRPTTGSVLVTTNVSGADVWVGNRRIQATPNAVEVGDLSPGRYPVKASRTGFKEWAGYVDVVAGRRADLVISLEQVPAPPPPPTQPERKPPSTDRRPVPVF